MDAHPRIGLAGARLVNPDGTHEESVNYCYPGQKHSRESSAASPGGIAWVLGAAMIAPTELIMKLQGFDETFFSTAKSRTSVFASGRRVGRSVSLKARSSFIMGDKARRPTAPSGCAERKVRADHQQAGLEISGGEIRLMKKTVKIILVNTALIVAVLAPFRGALLRPCPPS